MADDPTPDEILKRLLGNLADLAKTQMPQREEASQQALDAVAALLGTDAEHLAAGDVELPPAEEMALKVSSFLKGALSDDGELRAQSAEAQAKVLETLSEHGVDFSAQAEQLQQMLGRVATGEAFGDLGQLAPGLRRMADAFEGREDPDGDPDEIEKLKDALGEMGRGLLGKSKAEEEQATQERINREVADEIGAAMADFEFD